MGLKFSVYISAIFLILLVPSILAASTARTDKLNYFITAENHTIVITNNEGATINYNLSVPSGWTASNVSCTEVNSSNVFCNDVADGATAEFLLENPTTDDNYTITAVSITGGTTNDIKFIAIDPDEIFYTLVEYGRGRGNYPFDSIGDITYPYLPNGTEFELNYLHKIFNIKQYYGLASSVAENATWTCTYPNYTSIRHHLITNISIGIDWTASYEINETEGSWERMGFFGQRIPSRAYNAGDSFLINCTDVGYNLFDAGGNISIDEDSFSLEIRNREPVIVNASTTSTLGNGSQEVEIVYIINNSEFYPLDSVVVEIQSPQLSTFIGIRGELWGTSKDKYLMERTEIAASDSESITLVARFNTTDSAPISALNLSRGVKVKYITPWEANAYNPQEYIQTISAGEIGTLTVDMSVSSEIVNIQNRINSVFDIVTDINATVDYINNTIWGNLTAQDISDSINTTLNNTDNIITKIRQLREFEEEIVFLVTDSFGLQEDAMRQAEAGDRDSALQSLREANLKLKEAADKLETQIEKPNKIGLRKSVWPMIMVFVIILCIAGYFYFTKGSHFTTKFGFRKKKRRKKR